ncbi:sialic acid-binding Ig-like lectin 11 [Natator depressus]|uniref:sialic acid-binding Ig-like lectin 11 n=1 Tax=Natator depressus TaxID=27790 RepID=UPI003EB9824D
MGRALLPQQDTREWELPAQGPPWRAGGPAPPAATLRVLILALLWRGSLSLESGYSLAQPQSVSVQTGLCVLVPCTFAYPASFDTDNPRDWIYGHWFKDQANVGQDPPVASSNPSRQVSQETQGRFRLAGDLARGDCSLQINDARRTDAGRYFFGVEKRNFKYNYLSNSDGTDLILAISVPGLTEEPEIQISPAQGVPGTLMAGEPVTVTCTAPGRCSGPPPRVTWMGPFSDTARDVSAPLANSTWARSSALRFTPAPGDHGKELVCRVTYRPPWGPSTRRTVRLHVGYLPSTPNITGILIRNGRPGHPVMEGEGRTGRGPGNPWCPSPASRSGRFSATEEPTRNWNLTGLRKWRTRPQLSPGVEADIEQVTWAPSLPSIVLPLARTVWLPRWARPLGHWLLTSIISRPLSRVPAASPELGPTGRRWNKLTDWKLPVVKDPLSDQLPSTANGLSQPDAPAMGRARLPQQDTRERELPAQGPPWRAGGPALPAATLRVLILALLWRGSLSLESGYSLALPQSVSVQMGLCVLVPCTFAYPASFDTDNSWARLYGHWYKEPAIAGQDPPVASTNLSGGVSHNTQGRFRLAGDLARGDCSLQISDARRTDAGRYFLRVEKGNFKYSYRPNTYHAHPTLKISVPGLTEEPEIQISPARGLPGTLLAGEPVTVTCTAPGRCSGPPPRVTWTGPFSDTARDVSAPLENGTWARSSALRFTPAPGDHGKELVCTVTYRPPRGPSTRRTIRLHVGYLPSTPNITGILTRNGRPVPDAWGAEGDVVSLETQEGDSLSLGCEAGGRTEATLSWAKGTESLSPGQGGAGRLELPNLSRGDAGEYRCWAKNPFGSASRALRVHMQSPVRNLQITVSRTNRRDPQLFQDPGTPVANGSQLTAREGDSLRFLCSVASNPPAVLGWVRGGRAVEGARPTGENQLQLELPDVTAEAGGLYGCWARNEESSAQGTFQLLVEYSPRLGTGLNSSCQRQGPGISCSCSLRSHPPPQLQWQVDGEPLAGNGSRGALQVSSWAQGDEAVSTLSWTGSGDRGPRIFCLGSNPHGTYAALHFELSPPQRGAEEPGNLLGIGVACGLGVAVGIFLLGLCVIKLPGRDPATGTQAEHTADDSSLIYNKVTTIPMDHKTPAARRTKGVQNGAAAAQGPLGPGEPEELHYASIDFSKLQRKGGEPPEAPATEYSEIWLK